MRIELNDGEIGIVAIALDAKRREWARLVAREKDPHQRAAIEVGYRSYLALHERFLRLHNRRTLVAIFGVAAVRLREVTERSNHGQRDFV